MMIIGYLPSWRHFGRDLGHLNWRPFKWGTFFREDLVMHIVFLSSWGLWMGPWQCSRGRGFEKALMILMTFLLSSGGL